MSRDGLRLLFIGDVVGKPGRRAVRSILPAWREREGFDLVLANAENAAGGFGLTPPVAAELFEAGVDFLTLGNHAFANRDVAGLLANEPRVIRPANYPAGAPGRGAALHDAGGGRRLGILNLLGRVFMEPLDDPFAVGERELARLRAETPFLLVDFHAEATSEKLAFGWFADGKASAVVGTHTHIQTADERILPQGTGYITDVGMSGPRDGVLGIEKSLIVRKFQTQLPVRFEVAGGPAGIDALGLDLDGAGRTIGIRRYKVEME
ncbi:MAG: TIGR00282 family metallophosphoesterase [Patescibacteria group bacterium]